VSLAQRFALENDLVQADCIEATEFPDLATKYRVYAVPRTVINSAAAIEGALPEENFLDGILQSLQPAANA
jgi:Thioredoxin domain